MLFLATFELLAVSAILLTLGPFCEHAALLRESKIEDRFTWAEGKAGR